MKKIICMLLLIQGGFLMAQETETIVTVNGKKVQVNAVPTTADNGLTMTNGKIQLGGALLKPTTLTTTSANTLTIGGLQTGASTDNVLVADANGVLKWMTRAEFGGDNLGNHTATQALKMGPNVINYNTADGIKEQFLGNADGARIEHTTGFVLGNVAGIKTNPNSGQFSWSNYGAGGTQTELMRIGVTGNLGIGSTAPVSKLHVAGDMTLNKDLKVGGTATTAGNSGTDGQVLISKGSGAAPSWVDASTLTAQGDNLGNHTATTNLEMSNKDINNIYNARIKYELVLYDRTAGNTNTFNLYKNNGGFNIYNGLKGSNDLTINEATRKTTINNLAISVGTDGAAPATGYVATAADASGNIVWKAPSTTSVMGVKKINSNYTVAADDYTVIAAGMTGDITITLPATASNKGRILVINQNDVSNAGNELTVKFDVDVIYSSKIKAKELLAPFYSAATGGTLKINLQSDGTNWYVISSL